jgi:hypothetical protein
MAPTQLATTMIAISVPLPIPPPLLLSSDELAEGAGDEAALGAAVEVTLTLTTPGVDEGARLVERSDGVEAGAVVEGRALLEGFPVIPLTTELTSIAGGLLLFWVGDAAAE